MRRVLVTGGCSVLGRAVVERYAAKGDQIWSPISTTPPPSASRTASASGDRNSKKDFAIMFESVDTRVGFVRVSVAAVHCPVCAPSSPM